MKVGAVGEVKEMMNKIAEAFAAESLGDGELDVMCGTQIWREWSGLETD